MNRRQEYAAATRQAILDAARKLFTERGYFGTRVEDIAALARVAPASVYAVGGGKRGLLKSLFADGADAGRWESFDAALRQAPDALGLIRMLVDQSSDQFDEWAGLLRQVRSAAVQEPSAQESLDVAEAGIRNGCDLAAARLEELGALRAPITAAEAADGLYLHLCNPARFVRLDDLRWTRDRSDTWLVDTVVRTLTNLPPDGVA